MKWGDHYKIILDLENDAAVFPYLIKTLKQTNRKYDYFVDWQTVLDKVREIEKELHLLDVLIGKSDIKTEAVDLFQKYPNTMKAVPVLIAVRETELAILKDFDQQRYIEENIEFSHNPDPEKVAEFLDKVGFLKLLKDSKIHSVMDYVTGVEVGLGSNSRKNRGGKSMEGIIAVLLEKMCLANGWKIMPEATKKKLMNEWNIEIEIGKANKRIDFAINAENNLLLIETNFYSASGSKLKSTASEYSDVWDSYGHPFIWITDGPGWKNDNSLEDAFNKIDHILNIDMVQKGILEAIIRDHINPPHSQTV